MVYVTFSYLKPANKLRRRHELTRVAKDYKQTIKTFKLNSTLKHCK